MGGRVCKTPPAGKKTKPEYFEIIMPTGIGTTWAKAQLKKEALSMSIKGRQMLTRHLKRKIIEIATVARAASDASEEDACILLNLVEQLSLDAFERAERLEKVT